MKRTILVVGASGEIGCAIVRKLKKNNNQFILHYNDNESVIKNLINELDDDQLLATIKADLSTEEGIEQLVQLNAFQVDTIIFAQGKAHYSLLADTDSQTIDQMYRIHVKAPMLITKAHLNRMIQNREGQIIFVTSIWGEIGASNESIYASMKGAQNIFVKSLAKEIGLSGVRVNAVSPGLIKTKMNGQLDENDLIKWQEQVPIKRLGTVQDVANVVNFLVSDDAKYVHGQILRVNGGTL